MTDINIGALSEALNDKVDLDLLNINPVSESIGRIASWSFPTSREEIQLQESGHEYTATDNGYVYVAMDRNDNNCGLIVKAVGTLAMKGTTSPNSNTNMLVAFVPIKAGQKYVIEYFGQTTISAYFVHVSGDGTGSGSGGGTIIYGGGGFPDYSKGEAITTPYIIKKDGWVFWNASTAQGPQYLYVNDIAVAQVAALGANDTTSYTATIPVFKGDNVRWGEGSAVYYPLKDMETLGNRYLGQMVESFLPIEDPSLHLLDGAKLEYTGIYKNFIDSIGDLYGDGTNVPAYFCSESDWQTSVSSYGSCGRFVYDSVNKTVRLPKVSDIIQGTSNVNALGDLTEAGVPNITGSVNFSRCEINGTDGAFRLTEARTAIGANSDRPTGLVSFDASRSSSIYGKSDTVQPQTIKALYYMVVATGSREEVKLNFDAKADKDLVNTGFITNCITQIPQDIKVELNNGTLTLKAGSKIYVPNGNSVFNTVSIPNDITIQGWSNVSGIILIDNIGTSYAFTDLSHCYSGASSPTIGNGVVWYDTTNNIVKRCNDGSTWTSGYSLPIAIATSNNSNPSGISGIASLDKVFNGFGYIGNITFILPDVECLLPNGRNPDGTMISKKFKVPNVIIDDFTQYTDSNTYVAISDEAPYFMRHSRYVESEEKPTTLYTLWYDTANNETYHSLDTATFTKRRFCYCNRVLRENSTVIDMNPSKTFKAVDTNNPYFDRITSQEYVQKLNELGTVSGAIALESNKTYTMTSSGTITFTLPVAVDDSIVNSIRILYYQSTARTISWGTNYFYNGVAPDMTTSGYYDIYFDYNPILGAWVCGAMTQKTI